MPVTKSNAIPRPDLGVLVQERSLKAADQGFIASQVLPYFFTPLKSSEYPFIPAEAAIKHVKTKRAPRSGYARDDYAFDFKDYVCHEYGFESPLDDTELKLYRRFFDAEAVASDRAMTIVLRDYEMRVAELVQDPAIFDHAAATKKWDNYAEANPLADVTARKKVMRKKGIMPNALIINYDTYLDLGQCSNVLERINITNPDREQGELPISALSAYFKLPYIFVAGGVVNVAPEGKVVDAQDIWDPTMAVLARVSSGGPDLRELSLGRTMVWEDDTPDTVMVEEYRSEEVRGTVYRARMHVDELIQFTGAAGIITGLK